jgi:S-DNA-T family DNA segregation ATPase FtsK/SpoIIIE
MASRSAPAKSFNLWVDLLAVALLGGGVLALLALTSYHAGDNAWFFVASDQQRNTIGILGATIAYLLIMLMGLGAMGVPLLMLISGYFLMRRRRPEGVWIRSLGVLFGCAGILSLLHLGLAAPPVPPTLAGGGWMGQLLATQLRALAGGAGAVVIAVLMVLVGFLFASQIGLEQLFLHLYQAAAKVAGMLRARWTAWMEARRRAGEQRDLVLKHQERLEAEKKSRGHTMPPYLQPDITAEVPAPHPPAKHTKKVAAPRPKTETGEQLPMEFAGGAGAEFQRPPALLLDPAKGSASLDIELLKSQAAEIEKKFSEFSVVGKVVQWSPGPVVTTFEFQPDAGVALKSIINRGEDLCLALKATAIRIDRIPGKSTVGIEVPNAQREAIAFREIIESDAFKQHPSPLALALGKRMDGAPFVADLAQMPHLLIAGTTGSGKSVGLNSIITSLLFRCTPEECRLVLVDPKRVELGLYADVPHLLTPVVTEAKLAINALKWAVREMEERYKLLASCSVRNIMQFNKLVKDATAGAPPGNAGIAAGDSRLARPLPYIVVVIDEFADLMIVAPGDVETAVQRLAQMARAVGIHLVLATQRPSVDVISGLIKSNMQARVAFRVAQKIDSRVILDVGGAEKLLGMGDMLFLQPGTSQLLRLHGAYLSESEVGKVAKYLKRQGAPQYDESVLREEKPAGAEGVAGMVDEADRELFEKACELAIQMGELSATLFQNRLRLGQARARRIVDYLDQMGLLGPVEAGKPRKVNVEKTMEVLNKVRSQGILGGVPESGETVDLDEPTTIDSSLD